MAERVGPQSRSRGAGRDRSGGGGERSKPAVGNRARGRLMRAGRPTDTGLGGAIGNRAMGRLFDREAGGGERLDAGLRKQMESAFDADFSGVRLIRGSHAARGLGAEAVTRGERVHLAPGRYAPGTHGGKALIGHELAHVVQQRRGVRVTAQAKGVGINQDRGLEAEADRAGDRAARGLKAGIAGGAGRIGGPPVAQCKVGMEYQATSGGGTGVAKKVGHKWERPEHGELIAQGVGFKIETDFDDIEYITDAVDERNAGAVTGLRQATARAAAIHKKITESHTLTSDDITVTSFTDGDGFYEVKALSGKTYRLYKDGKKNAHPQATVGIRLDKLRGFIGTMGVKSDEATEHWQTVGYGRKTAEHRTAEQTMLRKVATDVQSEMAALNAGWQASGFSASESASGFLALLAQYVQGTTVLGKPRTANAKNAYALMGRSSLWAIYAALPRNDQLAVWEILTSVHDSYAAVREKLFGARSPSAIIVASQSAVGPTAKTTLKQLTDSMKPKDQVREEHLTAYSGVSELDDRRHKWGDVKGKYDIGRATDIGHDTDDTKVEGAIVEMRALGRNVAPDDWAGVSAAVCAIVRATNT